MKSAVIDIEEKQQIRQKAAKPLLWIAMISIVMLFAGLTSAYIVRKNVGDWLVFDLPSQFYISTVVILLSSFSMIYALAAAKKNNSSAITLGLSITLVLGIVFLFSQLFAWKQLVAGGIYLGGSGSNPSGSFLYILSGLHGLHIIGGLIALIVCLIQSLRKKYNSENRLGLQLCSTYWHFLDALWIYLLLFLQFIR
jgi:cytochrome c oxidase subunit III